MDLKPGLKFDALRILDLTACDGVGDDAISKLIPAAPRLRNLVLAKCRNITDQAVNAICTLTKNLHYIHLGHCTLLTDAAVIQLVQQCNRIRYIDLACCSRLTDASVKWLAKLPKLRRVGLVKCQNLTDESIEALARGPNGGSSSKPGHPTQFVSLERVHLSYCTSLTLKGITQLLLNCPRLTHLSLTGVQAFLRDDLTRFCREAPPEFTHVQRDVFCVFSGDGVERLRDYLARLALEQAERDQEQQSAIDEQVVGPDSPDADSLSDGTIDGTDPRQLDIVFGMGRHGLPRMSSSRARPRPRSFHDLPVPNFYIDMPLLPHDQMQRIGPWTPSVPILTPETRAQMTPQMYRNVNPLTFSSSPHHEQTSSPMPSPLPTPGLHPAETQSPRSRSQSRRHTMNVTDGFFGSLNQRNTHDMDLSSRQINSDVDMFGHGYGGPSSERTTTQVGPSNLERSQANNTSGLRPDPAVSSFEVNHDAILSTIPNSRGPSRGPSRSHSPHVSRVPGRAGLETVLGHARGTLTPPTNLQPNGRATRNRETSRQASAAEQRALQERTIREIEQRDALEAQASTSSRYRPLPELLPSDLIDQIMSSPTGTTMNSSTEVPNQSRGTYDANRTNRADNNVT